MTRTEWEKVSQTVEVGLGMEQLLCYPPLQKAFDVESFVHLDKSMSAFGEGHMPWLHTFFVTDFKTFIFLDHSKWSICEVWPQI